MFIQKTKVYISGPITGVSDFEKNFQSAEDYLIERGYEVVNPVKVGKELEKKNPAPAYNDYMRQPSLNVMQSSCWKEAV